MVGRKGHIDYSGKTEDSRVSRFWVLYKFGKTDKEIETETGSTHMMIYNWRRRFGLRKNQRIQPETVREVSKNDLNYIAGFLDGEGCISLRKRKDNKYFAPVIEFSNTNLDVLKFIRERLGLTVNVNIHESGCRGNRKMAYKFAIKGWRNCLHAAKLLIPYSMVKQKHLYILIKFLERRTEKFFMNTPYDETDWYYYNIIAKLNLHGRNNDIPQINIEGRFLTEKNVSTERNPKIGETLIESISESDANYLTGFFDAEGSVVINNYKNKFKPIILFANTNKEIIECIKEKIGVQNKIYIVDTDKLKKKIVYRIAITSFSNCLPISKRLFPYSIVKKERLGIMIKFIESRLRKSSHAPYVEEEINLREKMKSLNHRGL
jgi:intein-encoded DNA endonuclease-like protein